MKKFLYTLAALLLAVTACTKVVDDNALQGNRTLTDKLVGSGMGEIIPGSILVKTSGNKEELIGSLEGVLDGISVSAALPIIPRNMQVARKYGLDKWYRIDFDSETSPEKVAEKIAGIKSVQSIQYRRYIESARAEQVIPFTGTLETKADGSSDMPFNDPHASYQWNLHNDGTIAPDAVAGADVGVKDAWRLTGGDPSVIIAVFDDAIAYRHEDLSDAVWKNEAEISGAADVDDDGNGFIDDKYGFNFVQCFNLDSKPLDSQPLNSTSGIGHGTHVAGIIGATNGNGKGISSIAGGTGNNDGVRLMSCQIFNGNNSATDEQSALAFIYAADNGACIAQCSYGLQYMITDDDMYINGGELDINGTATKIDGSPLETAALLYFLDPGNSNHDSLEGNIAVFAAGNHSNPHSIYPGALPYVISVTAFGYDWMPGGYTNYGPGCNVSAPGGEWKGSRGKNTGMILSTGLACSVAGGYPGLETGKGTSENYVYMQGTSMACPHVSGVLALGIAYAKKLGKTFTRDGLTSLLMTSVNDLDQFNNGGTKKFYPPFSTTNVSTIDLNRYKGQMGTGAVDAWKFLMAIEGTPTILIQSGKKMSIDISRYCNPLDDYTITADNASRTSLGLSSDPVIKNGKLEIECSKIGSGKITLSGETGRMPYTRTLSVASRPFAANNGGWL